MGASNRALFERCPLCHKGVIAIAARRNSGVASFGLAPCSVCGAIFSAGGNDSFRLGFCDPHKLAVARGLKSPGEACVECTPFAGCLIDQTLSKAEWVAVGRGKIMAPWAMFAEEAGGFGEQEALAVGSLEAEVMHLIEDDVVHHESIVHLGGAKFVGAAGDEAQLLLTSRRIVIVHQAARFDIRLADIQKLEQSFPGFVITARSMQYPLYCLPAPGDPVYHAIVEAMKRLH